MTYVFNKVLVDQMENPPKATLGSLLSGHIRFLYGRTTTGRFIIGAEDDEPQTVAVRCATV